MGIKTYRLELDAERHPVLVMENEDNYRVEPLDEPAKIVELCDKMMRLKYLAEENVVMIAVDTKGYILGILRFARVQSTLLFAIQERFIYVPWQLVQL